MDVDNKLFLQYICLIFVFLLISIIPLIMCLSINYFITYKQLKKTADDDFLSYKRI